MKRMHETVDMVAVFRRGEPPEPVRFRFLYDNREYVIRVGKVVDLQKEQRGQNKNYIYRCQSLIGRRERVYELKFDGRDVRWELIKI